MESWLVYILGLHLLYQILPYVKIVKKCLNRTDKQETEGAHKRLIAGLTQLLILDLTSKMTLSVFKWCGPGGRGWGGGRVIVREK